MSRLTNAPSGAGRSPSPRFVGAQELGETLSIAAAADSLEAAFRGSPLPTTPLRASHPISGGELLLMPTWGEPGIGIKLVTIDTAKPAGGRPMVQGLFILFSADAKAPVAVVDGAGLTAIRTAAVSALGTRHLARPDATRLLIFGTGVQARAHLEAMAEIGGFTSAVIVSRAPDRARELVGKAGELGLEARVGTPEDVRSADVVCCCTSSDVPVFDGKLLAPGCHVNAIGAYRPTTREVDSATLNRSKVVVDDRDASLAEAGDLIIPINEGSWNAERIVGDLTDVAHGRCGRRDDSEITFLKMVGLAWEDLVIARTLLDRLGLPG